MKHRNRPSFKQVGSVLLASLIVLAGCTFVNNEAGPLPTAFVIPTLTPSITPSLTLFLSPTSTPSQTPVPTQGEVAEASPIVGATSTPSAADLTATALAVPPSNLTIQYFIPTPTQVSPGGSVTLAWAASGANQATIFRVNADGSFGESWQVDTTGTLTVSASGSGDTEKFVLRVGDGVNLSEADATINISCNRSWFFTLSLPSSCPASAAVTTLAAEEAFENGWIYWMSTTGKVYVMYEDGASPAWEVYSDTWSTAEAESDPGIVPPSGLFQPTRGIGKVWRNNSTVRDRLGWALNAEFGYTATFQQESGSSPDNVFFTEPGGQLARLESGGSTWRYGEDIP